MNKKHLICLGIALSTFTIQIQSQKNDPVLLKVNNTPITKSEFEYVYKKNNTDNSIEKKTLDEYLDLFIDFKLKVEEAKTLGIDTTVQFKREFNSYKDQLIAPNLVDSVTEYDYAKKIYDKQGENIEVSHILIKFEKDKMLPADTLEIYNKALQIRNRLVGKNPEAFEKVAKEVSSDPSAQQSERAGYLGWATALMFVQPFENAMYSLNVNEISMPVRSQFGYHIIKVHNRRPDPGRVNVAHIMFGFSQPNPPKEEVDSLSALAGSVYNKLKAGEDYATLCLEYSADKQSAAKGGELGLFGMSVGLPTEFKDASFALKNKGDISSPIKTSYGFHILKLIDRQDRASWDESKKMVASTIKRNDGNTLTKLETEKLCKDLNYKKNDTAFAELKTLANSLFPSDTLYQEKIAGNNETLFTIGSEIYSMNSFAEFLADRSTQTAKVSVDDLDNLYQTYLSSILKNDQKDYFVENNSDIKNLVNEYHDGILLFDVMNKEVWEKAAQDSIGLQSYFNKNKAKYNWDAPKYKGILVHCKDEAAQKRAQNVLKKYKKTDDWAEALKAEFSSDSIKVIRFERGVWAKGENSYVDYLVFNKKKGDKPEEKAEFPLFFVEGKTIKQAENYTDVKGLVVSDYQTELEKNWVKSLRDKYSVEVTKAVLETIK